MGCNPTLAPPGLMAAAVLHGTTAGLAGVFGEGAALDPGDDGATEVHKVRT